MSAEILPIFQGTPRDGNLISPLLSNSYGERTRENCVPHLEFTPGPGEVWRLREIFASNSGEELAYATVVVALASMVRPTGTPPTSGVDAFGNPQLRFGSSLTPVRQLAWGRPIPVGGGTTAIESRGLEIRGQGPPLGVSPFTPTPPAWGLWLAGMPGASFEGDGAVLLTVLAERRA